MEDSKLGISIRFIREWKPETFHRELSLPDMAFAIAIFPIDEDDIRTFPERLSDAFAFLRAREEERKRHIN